jgi:hypothetical protein
MVPFFRGLVSLALLVLPAGCATEPSGGLTGMWRSAPENLQPAGRYEVLLSFNSFGGFEQQVRNYGIYPGQNLDQLSAYTKAKGTYRTEGNRLIIDLDRQAWWDPTFYGPDEQEAGYEGSVYDDGRFTVDGDHLVLHYTSYPLDAPVPSSAEFTRER